MADQIEAAAQIYLALIVLVTLLSIAKAWYDSRIDVRIECAAFHLQGGSVIEWGRFARLKYKIRLVRCEFINPGKLPPRGMMIDCTVKYGADERHGKPFPTIPLPGGWIISPN